MRCIQSLAIVVAFAPAALASQQGGPTARATRPAPAATASVAPSRTAAAAFMPARLSRIDAWIQQLIDERKIPGAVVMIVYNGQVAYHKAFGVRDMGTRAPERTDDIFRIASQTKAITSLAVMMLWEEGRFQLDDPTRQLHSGVQGTDDPHEVQRRRLEL